MNAQPNTSQFIDVIRFCHEALNKIRTAASEKKLTLLHNFDDQLETIEIDQSSLSQVLDQLLQNAVDQTDAGHVGLAVMSRRETNEAYFIVWDSSKDVSTESVKQLWENTGDDTTHHSPRTLIKQWGGRLAGRSKKGTGTQLIFSAPWFGNVSENELEIPTESTEVDVMAATTEVIEAHAEIPAPIVEMPEVIEPIESVPAFMETIQDEPEPFVEPSVIESPIIANAVSEMPSANVETKPHPPLNALGTQPRDVMARPTTEIHAVDSSNSRGIILLAEDNSANAEVLTNSLTTHGFAVAVAHNGYEAVQMATYDRPDVILMDIQLPLSNGLEAMKQIRNFNLLAKTPIVAITSLNLPGYRERCLAAGASEYIVKPVPTNQLVKLVESYAQPA